VHFISHIIRAVYGFGYETIEVTGPQMILTMKLTTFAWNVYDGRHKEEVRSYLIGLLGTFLILMQELDKWQLSKRVLEYPSLLTFLGYSSVIVPRPDYQLSQCHPRFYFPGLLVGPYLDFAEYMEVINETMFQLAHVKAVVKAGRTVPPGRKRVAYTKLLMGLSFLGVFVVLGPTYNFSTVLKPEFAKKNLISR